MTLSSTMSLIFSILFFASFSYGTILNDTAVHEHAFSSSCPTKRPLWKIITSCATTLFACAWTAIHPNMPGPAEGAVIVGLRRLGIMILALAAPEAVLMWATRQFFAARVVQKQFQKALLDGTLEVRVKPGCEPQLVSATVPCDEDEVRVVIGDKSASWFENFLSLRSSIMAMFPSRSCNPHEKLGLLSTSIGSSRGYCHWTLKHSFYAWMGGFMLFVDKDPALPREAYHPLTPDELLEFLTAGRVQMFMVSEQDLDDRSKGDWLSKAVAVMQLIWFVLQLAARNFGQLPTTQLEIASLAISILGFFTYAFWWYKPEDARCATPVYWKKSGEFPEITYGIPLSINGFLHRFGVKRNWIRDHFGDLYRPLLNLEGVFSVSATTVNAHRVPTLCGYPPDVDKETFGHNLPVIVIGGLTGIVFGGIHCVAWDFTFPTHLEQLLWRIASLGITIMPGLALVVVTSTYLLADAKTTRIPHPTAMVYSIGFMNLIYGGFRFVLIPIMLSSLRSLPAGVYDEVCWTSLVPHWY